MSKPGKFDEGFEPTYKPNPFEQIYSPDLRGEKEKEDSEEDVSDNDEEVTYKSRRTGKFY